MILLVSPWNCTKEQPMLIIKYEIEKKENEQKKERKKNKSIESTCSACKYSYLLDNLQCTLVNNPNPRQLQPWQPQPRQLQPQPRQLQPRQPQPRQPQLHAVP